MTNVCSAASGSSAIVVGGVAVSSILPYSVSNYASSNSETSFSTNYLTTGVSNVIISISCGQNACSGSVPAGCSPLFSSTGPDGYETTYAAACLSQPAGNYLINGTLPGVGGGYAAVSVYEFAPSSTTTSTSTSTSTTSTSLTTSSSTSSSTTSETTSTPPGGGHIIDSSGEGGLVGGGSGGGGGGSHGPTIAKISTTTQTGWTVSNYTPPESVNLKILNKTFAITLDSISPGNAGLTINGASYSLVAGSLTILPGGYSLVLDDVSYLPVQHTVSMRLYLSNYVGPSTSTATTTLMTTSSTIATTVGSTTIPANISTSPVSNSTTSTMPGSPTAALITVGVGCIIVAIMGFLAVSRRRKNEVKVA